MSDIFKTKEVIYIDNCRELNFLECVGLITNGLQLNKILPTGYMHSEVTYFKENFLLINKYIFKCDSYNKTSIITIFCKNDIEYEIHFIPKDTNGIQINIINTEHGGRIGYIKYSIEELEDLLI